MDGDVRRERILHMLSQAQNPISGAEFSRQLGVSRQIIVQDIALLRAVNKNILSTNKGYLLFSNGNAGRIKKTVCVKHTNEEILDELCTIVDLGGRVLDVVVEHEIYGQITVDLLVFTRQDAIEFVEKVKRNNNRPLNELTNGRHMHTIEAESEKVLDQIVKSLDQKGYLVKDDLC